LANTCLQDVSSIVLSSDEMELYAKVLRQFRAVFLQQEHMNIFKIYDFQDVSCLPFAIWLIADEFILFSVWLVGCVYAFSEIIREMYLF